MIEFQYKHAPGETWASGYISKDSNKFEFTCSCLFNNPLEELLNAVYQIVPDLAAFPRKHLDFIMLDEPTEYRWEFLLMNKEKITINIYEKVQGSKAELVLKESFCIEELLKTLVYCISNEKHLSTNENIDRIYKQFKIHLKST